MTTFLRKTAAFALVATIGAVAACNDSDTAEWGTINLAVTDAPVDGATRVVVAFTGVEIQAADGTRELFTFDPQRQIDLLALQGGGSEILLDGELLPAGRYEWIRLLVNAEPNTPDSFIEFDDGAVHSLSVPSAQGLRLVSGFVVAAGGNVDFTIDFDLRRAVVGPPGLGGAHLLRPALRLVDNNEVGAIDGIVDLTLITDGCAPAVYVYVGADAAVGDVQPDSGPLASARVEQNVNTGDFEYRVAFLEAGDYTVAFTCDALADDPDAADELSFTGGTGQAVVTAGGVATVDFPVGG